MSEWKIDLNQEGLVTSISENDDWNGHSEGGFVLRDQDGFKEELDRYLTHNASVYELMELMKSKDPVLRSAIGKVLLNLLGKARPIIQEERKAQKAEEDARKTATVEDREV